MFFLPVFEFSGNFKNLDLLSLVHQYISTKGTSTTTESAHFNSMFIVNSNRDWKQPVIVCLDVSLNSF